MGAQVLSSRWPSHLLWATSLTTPPMPPPASQVRAATLNTEEVHRQTNLPKSLKPFTLKETPFGLAWQDSDIHSSSRKSTDV